MRREKSAAARFSSSEISRSMNTHLGNVTTKKTCFQAPHRLQFLFEPILSAKNKSKSMNFSSPWLHSNGESKIHIFLSFNTFFAKTHSREPVCDDCQEGINKICLSSLATIVGYTCRAKLQDHFGNDSECGHWEYANRETC